MGTLSCHLRIVVHTAKLFDFTSDSQRKGVKGKGADRGTVEAYPAASCGVSSQYGIRSTLIASANPVASHGVGARMLVQK